MSDFAICFEMGTVEFKCTNTWCNAGTDGDMYCSHCDGQGVLIEYVKTWFDNLAMGAALCLSYSLNRQQRGPVRYGSRQFYDKPWRPSCGRAAPGFGGEG